MHIRELRRELKQKCSYRGGSKTKRKEHTLKSNKLQVDLGAKENFEWSDSPLEVTQDLPPSGLNYCSIIDIEYWIEVGGDSNCLLRCA